MSAQLVFRIILLIAVVGCATTSSSGLPAGAEVMSVDASLGPGDTFEVRVFDEKELSGEFAVANDGTIDYPLVGRIHVAGKESNVVAAEIAAALKERQVLNSPHVTIRLRDVTSKRVSVLGAVAKPGTQPMVAGMTIVQAISQAGGFTPLASKDQTVVTRRTQGGKLKRYRIAMTEITRGNSDDFAVSPGDIIFVPERVF
jgi:protein involved in polysaccharide export with SLBB domain